jgi:hypothetical protein
MGCDPPRLSRRPTLALLAVLTLSWATAPCGSAFAAAGAVLALVALGLALAACLLPERSWTVPQSLGGAVVGRALLLLAVLAGFEAVWKWDAVAAGLAALCAALLVALRLGKLRPAGSPATACLTAAALLLSANGVLKAEVLYGATGEERTPLLALAALLGFLLCAGWLFDGAGGAGRGLRWRLLLVFVAGGLLRAGGLLASPEPVTDVFVALRDAPAHLLAGRDPYAADYPDPYAGERAAAFGVVRPPESASYPFYPPLPLLAALPFRAAGLDVRWLNVAADLAAALVLYLVAARCGRPRDAALLVSLYLLMPRAPFLIEQAWYEPLLAALLGGGLLLAERGWRAGYLLLGLGLTGKQFGPALLPPLLRPQRRHWRALLAGLGAAALLFVPFYFWDAPAFLDVVLFSHLRRGEMLDSITLYTAAYRTFGVALPRPLLLGTAAALIAALSWRASETGTRAALGMGTALLTFCLFHTQGYFNYFYLCQYLILLGLAGGVVAPRATSAAPEEIAAAPG